LSCDLDGSGVVDAADLAIAQERWGLGSTQYGVYYKAYLECISTI
jgi:hypothetical protein